MAGIDTQKQLLSLIRDFTSERSRGGKIIFMLSLAFVFLEKVSRFGRERQRRRIGRNFEKIMSWSAFWLKCWWNIGFGYDFHMIVSVIRRNYGSDCWWFSRKEQRVVGLKKRIESLQSEVEAANEEVEHAKRIKEVAEEELNGYEVESSLNDATIQSLEVLFCA